MNILGVVQARMSSTRLPGKVLKPVLDKPMLQLQMERMLRIKKIDKIVIATSTDPSDDAIEKFCLENGYDCFRGSLTDVLDRYYYAALPFRPMHVVRLTADCPVIDPEVVDEIIEYHLEKGFDYTSNTVQPTFPDGLDAEVFTFQALQTAWREASLPSEREHVTPFIHQRPERFSVGQYINDIDYSHYRWTVDEQRDYELISKFYNELYPFLFGMKDILAVIERDSELAYYNTMYERNEGYKKSIEQEQREKSDSDVGKIR